MNTRRNIIIALSVSLLTAMHGTQAQQVRKTPQVGYVGNATWAQEAALVEGFRQGLGERGYIEGKNIVIHYRWAEGKKRRFSYAHFRTAGAQRRRARDGRDACSRRRKEGDHDDTHRIGDGG
jgi:hypothetical protein